MNRKRWLLRLAIVPVAGLALFLWATRERSPNRLTVENHSGQSIPLLRVVIAGEPVTFRDVAAGAEVTAPLRSKSEAPFVLEGQLAGGTMLRVKGTIGERPRFVVLPGGDIQFQQGEDRK